MKTIIKYKAKDGKEFNKKTECIRYEKLIDRVNLIMSDLHPIPKDDGCKFSNGNGYIQQDIETFKNVRVRLLKEIGRKIKHKWVWQSINDDKIDPSWVGRLVGDYSCNPLNSAWYRISCIDSSGREWGQTYYRKHPSEAKQIQLNKSKSE